MGNDAREDNTGKENHSMKDPRVEQWLTREEVDWHWEKAIPLSRVDLEASLKNQARLRVSLIPEHVDELSISVKRGCNCLTQ